MDPFMTLTPSPLELAYRAFRAEIEPDLTKLRPPDSVDGNNLTRYLEPQKARAYGRRITERKARLTIKRVNKTGYQSPPPPQPLPGEMSLKAWIIDEAQRHCVCANAIRNRIRRGGYPNLVIRKVGRNQQWVKVNL